MGRGNQGFFPADKILKSITDKGLTKNTLRTVALLIQKLEVIVSNYTQPGVNQSALQGEIQLATQQLSWMKELLEDMETVFGSSAPAPTPPENAEGYELDYNSASKSMFKALPYSLERAAEQLGAQVELGKHDPSHNEFRLSFYGDKVQKGWGAVVLKKAGFRKLPGSRGHLPHYGNGKIVIYISEQSFQAGQNRRNTLEVPHIEVSFTLSPQMPPQF